MAANDALLPEEAIIYIVDNGTSPGSLASSDAVQAEVTNFSESGGDEELESTQVFGGGNIDVIKPRTQIEVSFDVVLRYGTGATKWDSYKWGSGLTSAGDSPKKDVYVQFSDGSLFYTRAYQAARGVMFEPSASADGMMEGSMTFKLSPTNSDSEANLKVTSTAASTVSWS